MLFFCVNFFFISEQKHADGWGVFFLSEKAGSDM